MKIVIMQPTYLPWSGYFELMYNCELFVFLDDVQFNKRSWQRRNRIKTANGELMLAIPVRCLENYSLIKDVLINNEIPWNVKHLSAIKSNYSKATFFNRYFEEFEDIYSLKYLRLLDLNLALINFLKKHIGINTPSILSSALGMSGARNERLINLCKILNADTLYDAKGAKEILDLDVFRKNDLKIIFQEYTHPTYRQLHGDFISHLSALDLLFNEGERSLEIILSGSLSRY